MTNNSTILNIKSSKSEKSGDIWVEVENGKKSCRISIGRFSVSDTYGFKLLRSIGITSLTNTAKNQIKEQLQNATPNGKILVAERLGYILAEVHGVEQVVAYAYGSGEIIRGPKAPELEIIPGFDPIANFSQHGDDALFQKSMGKLVKDQAIPVLVLGLSLAPILQPFVPPEFYVENCIVELSGPPSSAKSACAIGLGGGVWGAFKGSKLGYFNSWNGTVNALEESMKNFNNALLGLDEATAISGSQTARAEAISNFVHRFSLELPKKRLGEPDQLPVHSIAISTSNQGLVEICKESPDVVKALLSRLTTIKVPERKTKIFERYPMGFSNFGKASAQFYVIGQQNCGHVARNMIAKTLKHLAKNPQNFQLRIGKLMRSIMDDAHFDEMASTEQRQFKVFALAYAAGFLAKDWAVLNNKYFGKFKEPLLRAWKMTKAEVAPDVRESYINYLHKYSNRIVVIDNKDRPDLTDSEFNKTKAFIVKTRDGQHLAAFPPHFMPTRLPGFQADFRRLREQGLAVCDEDGLQSKLRIRTRDGKVLNERVYAIVLDRWPLQ
jgi:hypothetical protein